MIHQFISYDVIRLDFSNILYRIKYLTRPLKYYIILITRVIIV
jgi:hypothetical protein